MTPARTKVSITYTIGDVHVVRNGKKGKIEAVPFKKSVGLKDGDKIITGPHSYVVDLSDRPGPGENGTLMVIFPNSEIGLGIKGGLIIRMELTRGLFSFGMGSPPEKEIITPTAEFRDPGGKFWIDVAKDGAVVVASEGGPMEVVHKKTKKGVVIGFKQQVTVTQESILEPCGVDQRFKEAHKVWEMLEQSHAKFLYGDMLERRVPQELQKLAKGFEEKTGRKEDYDLTKYEKWLKEQKEFGEWKYDEAVKSELPEFKPLKVEKTISKSKSVTTDINKTVNYQGIHFKIVSAEKGMEFKGRNAPPDKDFLVLNIGAKNNSNGQVILFYDEEVRLISTSGEIVPLENYKLENNFGPQSETAGFLLFLVPKEDSRFKLQFGKKSQPKVEAEFELKGGSA